MASLEDFSQNLFDNVEVFRGYGDKAGADLIGSSCIACLTHLAALYEVIGRMYPDAGEAGNLCDSALRRLGNLTSDLRFDEYTYLDLPLGVRPFFRYFLTLMTQTGDRDRTLGGNRWRSSTSALRVSQRKRASRCGISGRSLGNPTPIFRPNFLILSHRCSLWLGRRMVPRRIQSLRA